MILIQRRQDGISKAESWNVMRTAFFERFRIILPLEEPEPEIVEDGNVNTK